MHPFIQPNTSTARLLAALKLITDNPNGDTALADLAQAIRRELASRKS